MMGNETTITKDESGKKLIVVREFAAPVAEVWRAWTEPSLLDQWWAPKPWKAHTQSMEFKEGGRWLYYMQGPEGEKHYSYCDYHTIEKEKHFTGKDGFCDEKGNVMKEPPGMDWDVVFTAKGDATVVTTTVSFASEEDLKKIVEMGFQEGFTAAHSNLDEVLVRNR